MLRDNVLGGGLDLMSHDDRRRAVLFGRYEGGDFVRVRGGAIKYQGGRLVDTRRGVLDDLETGHLREPVELDPGVYFVLMPGGLLCTRPLIVKRRTLIDRLEPT